LLRYVDDLFSPEKPECMDHAMHCFVRMVRVFLGPDAIEEKKLERGMCLTVLGAQLDLAVEGFTCRPAPKTVAKCLSCIRGALQSDLLMAGDAQKLAGRLNWSTQHLFQRLGRAMLRPIYQQKYSRCDWHLVCGCACAFVVRV